MRNRWNLKVFPLHGGTISDSWDIEVQKRIATFIESLKTIRFNLNDRDSQSFENLRPYQSSLNAIIRWLEDPFSTINLGHASFGDFKKVILTNPFHNKELQQKSFLFAKYFVLPPSSEIKEVIRELKSGSTVKKQIKSGYGYRTYHLGSSPENVSEIERKMEPFTPSQNTAVVQEQETYWDNTILTSPTENVPDSIEFGGEHIPTSLHAFKTFIKNKELEKPPLHINGKKRVNIQNTVEFNHYLKNLHYFLVSKPWAKNLQVHLNQISRVNETLEWGGTRLLGRTAN